MKRNLAGPQLPAPLPGPVTDDAPPPPPPSPPTVYRPNGYRVAGPSVDRSRPIKPILSGRTVTTDRTARAFRTADNGDLDGQCLSVCLSVLLSVCLSVCPPVRLYAVILHVSFPLFPVPCPNLYRSASKLTFVLSFVEFLHTCVGTPMSAFCRRK